MLVVLVFGLLCVMSTWWMEFVVHSVSMKECTATLYVFAFVSLLLMEWGLFQCLLLLRCRRVLTITITLSSKGT